MRPTGKQKAAMLLMSLDPMTASELLKGVDPAAVQELAVELAYLEAAGQRDTWQRTEVIKQFCSSLQNASEFQFNRFLGEMLRNALGNERAEQIQTQIQDLLQKRDPFMPIRSADAQSIAAVLEHEHPQASAVVLSELPPKKSSEVLGLLSESIRLAVVRRITTCDTVTPEAKRRIAETVSRRLESLTSTPGTAAQAQPEQTLRKVAVILRNLGTELREGLLDAIKQSDDQAAAKITELMIIWEDIPQIADRPLQEALRGLDAKDLALALTEADEAIVRKIRSNISERAAATLDEEASLMSAPKQEEINEARGKIVAVLREMDEKGDLSFLEE